jgi:broad specificity phosphatase PhoE
MTTPPTHAGLSALLIEHGETRLDAAGQAHGGRDEPLDRRGREQAIRLGLRLRRMQPQPAILLHSDRKRAAQTAKLAGHVAGIPEAGTPALAPLDAGALGRGPQAEVARRLAPYFRNPERAIPGGETVAAWRARHMGFMRRAALLWRRPAFVTHSNVIGSALGGAGGAMREMARPPRPATPIPVLLPAEGGNAIRKP